MDATKWASLATAVAVSFEDATPNDIRDGTRLFLEAYCANLQEEDTGTGEAVLPVVE